MRNLKINNEILKITGKLCIFFVSLMILVSFTSAVQFPNTVPQQSFKRILQRQTKPPTRYFKILQVMNLETTYLQMSQTETTW